MDPRRTARAVVHFFSLVMAFFLVTGASCEEGDNGKPCLSFEICSLVKRDKKVGYTIYATLDRTCDGVLMLMENRTKNAGEWVASRRLDNKRIIKYCTRSYTLKNNNSLADDHCYCLKFESSDDKAPYFSNAFIKKDDKFEPIALDVSEKAGKKKGKGDSEDAEGSQKIPDALSIVLIALSVFIMLMLIVIIAINM